MYRTKCAMYDEVSVGNPGKVPYCAKQDKLEPDCQHCKQQYVTNADRIRSMSDEELAIWINDVTTNALSILALGSNKQTKNIFYWLKWLKEEVKENAN